MAYGMGGGVYTIDSKGQIVDDFRGILLGSNLNGFNWTAYPNYGEAAEEYLRSRGDTTANRDWNGNETYRKVLEWARNAFAKKGYPVR